MDGTKTRFDLNLKLNKRLVSGRAKAGVGVRLWVIAAKLPVGGRPKLGHSGSQGHFPIADVHRKQSAPAAQTSRTFSGRPSGASQKASPVYLAKRSGGRIVSRFDRLTFGPTAWSPGAPIRASNIIAS